MLQLGSTTKVVDGVTVFSDHADPNRFWYLPAPVQLAERPDGAKAFTFIKYTDKAKSGGARGGGFLMFETMLTLDDATKRRIESALRSESDDPQLEMVPFDEGTVECVALNLQGGGGTTAVPPSEPGGFNAVEEILGTSVPGLFGDNRALFSLTLSPEGATILEQALAKQAAPIGVIYKLTFTALRPSLHVRIKADLERVYDELSAGLSANVAWFSASLEAAFQKLQQDGVIHIKVLTFSTDDDLKDKEKWALDFFRDNLLRDWFTPSLSPQTVPATPTGPSLPTGTTPPRTGTTSQPRVPVTGSGATGGQSGPAEGSGATTSGTPRSPVTTGGTANPDKAESPGRRRVTALVSRGPHEPPAEGGGEGTPPGGGAEGGPAEGEGGAEGGGEGTPPGGGAEGGPAEGGGGAEGGGQPGIPPRDPTKQTPPAKQAPPRIPAKKAAEPPAKKAAEAPAKKAAEGPAEKATEPAKKAADPAKATTGTPDTSTQGTALVSFKLRYVHQEEKKRLDVTYDRADAVQRVYAPQGYFSLLAGDLDDPRYFLEVDLDDPFFRSFPIDVRCRTNYDTIGLTSVNVALTYGRDSDPGGPKQVDFVFDRTTPTEQRFEPAMNAALDTTFRYRIEYNFTGGTDWRGQDTTYVVEGESEDRTLEVDPHRHLGFLDVGVRPGDIDGRVVAATDVHLRYEGPDGWVRTDVVPVTPGGTEQRWRLRSRDREARRFGYTLVHTLADGTTVTTEPASTEASSLLVADPFPGLLPIDLIPMWDPAAVRTVFVDITYADAANSYRREERVELPGAQATTVRVPIAIRDVEQRAFDCRATFVNVDHSSSAIQFTGRTDTLVQLRPA